MLTKGIKEDEQQEEEEEEEKDSHNALMDPLTLSFHGKNITAFHILLSCSRHSDWTW